VKFEHFHDTFRRLADSRCRAVGAKVDLFRQRGCFTKGIEPGRQSGHHGSDSTLSSRSLQFADSGRLSTPARRSTRRCNDAHHSGSQSRRAPALRTACANMHDVDVRRLVLDDSCGISMCGRRTATDRSACRVDAILNTVGMPASWWRASGTRRAHVLQVRSRPGRRRRTSADLRERHGRCFMSAGMRKFRTRISASLPKFKALHLLTLLYIHRATTGQNRTRKPRSPRRWLPWI
jgi:hypothetical protein